MLGDKLGLERSHNQQMGYEGERIAEYFLLAAGYALVLRNYRFDRGEIDLIMRQGDCLVFVEVKTRQGSSFGYPEEAVTISKEDKLLQTAEAYVHEQGWTGSQRFDIIAIELGKKPSIAHFIDALV